MCTGLEITPLLLGAMGASTLGTVLSGMEAEKQASAIANAQNRELSDFMKRNKQRSDQAYDVYNARTDDLDKSAVKADQAGAESKRNAETEAIIAEAPAAAAPTTGSAASVIGGVFDEANSKEAAKGKARREAYNRQMSFGDQWFDQGLKTADASRKIGTIADFGGFDSSMLGTYQDLAGAEAAARKRPSPIGAIFSGLGQGAGYYLGAGGKPPVIWN